MSDKTNEEIELEAELRAKTEEKKAVFAEISVREADERLRKIREGEDQIILKLQKIRADKIEKAQRERHAPYFEAQQNGNKDAELCAELEALKTENEQLKRQVAVLSKDANEKQTLLAELRAELEALKMENEQLKRQVAVLSKDANEKKTLVPAAENGNNTEIDLLAPKNSEQNVSLGTPTANLKGTTTFSERQQNLKQRKEEDMVKRLEDKISAAQQILVETQLRQLHELRSLTKETKELKQTLTTELHLQQRKPTAEEHQQSKYSSLCLG